MLAMFAVVIVYYLIVGPIVKEASKTLACLSLVVYVAACITLFYLFIAPILSNPTYTKPSHPLLDQGIGLGVVFLVLLVLFCVQRES